MHRVYIVISGIIWVTAVQSAVAGEAFVPQAARNSLASYAMSSSGLPILTNTLATPIPLSSVKPVAAPASIDPRINASFVAQAGTNNFAAVAQSGGGNLSSIVQHGVGNQAVVTQTRSTR